jgi:single-stranded-DNA-specific exonuclease
MDSELLHRLEYLQPTGYGNPEALFISRNVRITNKKTVGADGNHLKLVITDGRITFDAIGFRLGHLLEELPAQVDILFTFESNEYNGRKSIQLNLKDVKPAEQS